MKTMCAIAVGLLGLTAAANAQVHITEFEYDMNAAAIKQEWVELTNTSGVTTVDVTGWSQDDSTGVNGAHMINLIKIIGGVEVLDNTLSPGESCLLIEDDPAVCDDAAAFRATWGQGIGRIDAVGICVYGRLDNLGRSDTINLYDCSGTLVDHIQYNDTGNGGCGVRAKGTSATVLPADVGFSLYCGGGGHSAWFLNGPAGTTPAGMTTAAWSNANSPADTGTPGFYP